jgi:hypothetical protein
MKKAVHPGPTDDVTLAHPESLLSADVTMDSPDDLCCKSTFAIHVTQLTTLPL